LANQEYRHSHKLLLSFGFHSFQIPTCSLSNTEICENRTGFQSLLPARHTITAQKSSRPRSRRDGPSRPPTAPRELTNETSGLSLRPALPSEIPRRQVARIQRRAGGIHLCLGEAQDLDLRRLRDPRPFRDQDRSLWGWRRPAHCIRRSNQARDLSLVPIPGVQFHHLVAYCSPFCRRRGRLVDSFTRLNNLLYHSSGSPACSPGVWIYTCAIRRTTTPFGHAPGLCFSICATAASM